MVRGTMDLRDRDLRLKDLYPDAGTRIKQWVVELRRELAWVDETCPRVHVPFHYDNTGAGCRNDGPTLYMHLAHDCCEVCCDLHEASESQPEIAAWRTLKAERPPITSDREALSDEIAPAFHLRDHPTLAALAARKREP